MKKLLTVLVLLFPLTVWGADVSTVSGVPDSSISTISGVPGASISTICGVNYNDGDAACADSSCTGFLVCQNFETATTGYDNSETWTETGTVEAAYTTGPLRGSQSCQLSNSSRTYISIGDQTELYVFFRMDMADKTPSLDTIFFSLLDGSADAAKITLLTTGTVSCTHGTKTDTNATPFAAGTNYIWIHYKGNSGAGDGVLSMHRGSSRIYSEATEICSITNGDDASTNSDTFRLTNDDDGGMGPIFDQVLVKTTAIGDVCE
jgi:hypothetical protein